ncbi:MAG: pterin-binding protein [Dehalococcoidia bacterium]|nr:MAG: pterin-binding protein [Dehalococcoidia bacterium]
MQTRISSKTREVIISDTGPTIIIGERINPTGKKKLQEELLAGRLDMVRTEALQQVRDGADVLDVNVGATGVDEVVLLPEAVKAVMEVTDVPLCIDSGNPRALEAALRVYVGRPLINSVTAEQSSMNDVLALAKEHDAAVIGLTMDEKGIPPDAARRIELAHRIVEQAERAGIKREDVVIDCLNMPAAANAGAPSILTETIQTVRSQLGVNMTLGASNVSFGLPERSLLNGVFLSIVIHLGVNCPVVDVAKVRQYILAADALLGKDQYMRRFIQDFRKRQKAAQQA